MKSIFNFLFGFISGALVGCVVVSLYTPKPGENFREDILKSFDEIKLDYELGKQKKKEDLEQDLKRRCGE